MENKGFRWDLSTATLHILAMTFMLLDHSWATIFPGQEWMTCVGRIAFPIFAFMLVEGYFHTHNLKKYMLRMLVFALISEIPFDIMYGGQWFYPYHQNVLWTFLIALGGIYLMEKIKQKGKLWLTILVDALIVIGGLALGYLTMVDYYGIGIVTVFVFYFFRKRTWWCLLGQVACLYFLNVEILGGYYYPVNILGFEVELVQQSLALLALIPIWLYRGRQGYHSKPFQYFCYAFYPLHILVLDIILEVMFRINF